MSYDYSDVEDPPDDDLLKQISKLVLRQQEAELSVAKAEDALKEAQRELREICEHLLPPLMEEAGMQTLTTADGIRVKIKEDITASIPEANRPEAFAWLDDHGHARLIKHEIKVLFGKDDHEWAQEFLDDCSKRKRKLNLSRRDFVEPMTLKSFIKKELEDGVDVPMDLFGAYRRTVSKIEVPEQTRPFEA